VGWAAGEWNPYFIPPLILLDVMICSALLERRHKRNVWLWVGAGLVNGVLLATHSTALFVVPISFGLFSVYYAVRHRQWLGPTLAWLMLLATLAPYIAGEIPRHFSNTKMLVEAIMHAPRPSLLVRVDRVIGLEVYGASQSLLSIAPPNLPHIMSWLSLIALLPAWVLYRVERRMVALFGLPFVLFLLVGSSYDGELYPHYVLLAYFVPFLCLLGGVFHLAKTKTNATLAALCASLLVGSLVFNIYKDIQLVHVKMTSMALPNVTDKREALAEVPAGAIICVVPGAPTNSLDLEYIDAYVGSTHHQFNHGRCLVGDYQIVPIGTSIVSPFDVVGRAYKYTIARQE